MPTCTPAASILAINCSTPSSRPIPALSNKCDASATNYNVTKQATQASLPLNNELHQTAPGMPVPTFSGGVEAKNGCVHTSIAPPAASTAASPQSTVHIARDKVPACFNGNTFRLLLAMTRVVLAVTRRDTSNNCNARTPRRVPRFMLQIATMATLSNWILV